jgi:hypothetical protein
LLALVGVGIGLTALHHHNERRGVGPGPSITPVARIIGPAFGFRFADLSINGTGGTVGALETSGTGAQFNDLSAFILSYFLPTGYFPQALAVDPSGDGWFVDSAGNIKECAPPSTTGTTCTPVVTYVDGLAAGGRSIAMDGTTLIIVQDAGSGNVNVAYEQLGGTIQRTSYHNASGASIFSADAVESVGSGAGSVFAVSNVDGTSTVVSFPFTTAPSFTFSPVPAGAPSNVQVDPSTGNATFSATTGSFTGTYQITRYISPSSSPIGSSFGSTSSIVIELNGQFGGPALFPPLTSLHIDGSLDTFVVDSAGNVEEFAPF